MSDNYHAVLSASLRSRPVWDVLLPIFDSNTNLTFEESPHNTYDIAFQLSGENSSLNIDLRTILVVPSCVEEPNRQATLTHAEQFVATHRSDRRPCHQAIIFLNSDTAFQTASGECTTNGLVSLQVLLFDSPSLADLPIIMVAEPAELLPSLQTHCHILQRNLNPPASLSHLYSSSWSSSSSLWLLEQIVAHSSHQHTCQQNLNILSDLFPSLRALSAGIRTVEGYQLIAEYIGDHVARNIAAFWAEEWVCG